MSPYKPEEGDLVMWHLQKGRHKARPGYFHIGPDGPYIIPSGGGDPVPYIKVHPIGAQLPDSTCAWCPTAGSTA
jgi:hypothetical protein